MKTLDKLADHNYGHYVVPKAPTQKSDDQMRTIIAQMKKNLKTNKA